jgi:hypothetical protein
MTLRDKISLIDVDKLSLKGRNIIEGIKELVKIDAKRAEDAIDRFIASADDWGRDIFRRKVRFTSKNPRVAASYMRLPKQARYEEDSRVAAALLTTKNTPKIRAQNKRWKAFRAKQKGYAGVAYLGGL